VGRNRKGCEAVCGAGVGFCPVWIAATRFAARNVVDLMEALRKSVGGAAADNKDSKKADKRPRKAAAGQKEMLMPIHGKKEGKQTAKKPAAKPQRKSA
jgi:DNA end-binding protein Ku